MLLISQGATGAADGASAEGTSPALRSLQLWLRRWIHKTLKPLAIGLITLVVLINAGVDNIGAETSGLSYLSAPNEGAVLPAHQHHVIAPGNQLSAEASISVASTFRVATHAPAPQASSRTADAYFGLDAHMTHYRLTRSRLSIPHMVMTHRVSSSLPVGAEVH